MPGELGEGERDETPEEGEDELEEVRDRIKEQYEGSDDGEREDHSGDVGGDQADELSEREHELPDKSEEAADRDTALPDEESEEPRDQGQNDAGEEERAESGDFDEDDDLERLRERVNGQYENAADEVQSDGAQNAGEKSEETGSELEPTHDEGPLENPSEDAGQGQEAHQEQLDPGEEPGESEVSKPESENIVDEVPRQSEELVSEGHEAGGLEGMADPRTLDSEGETNQGPTNDDGEGEREEPESPDRISADSLDSVRAEGSDVDASLEEEVLQESNRANAERSDSNSRKDDPTLDEEREQPFETEEGIPTASLDAGETETSSGGNDERHQPDVFTRSESPVEEGKEISNDLGRLDSSEVEAKEAPAELRTDPSGPDTTPDDRDEGWNNVEVQKETSVEGHDESAFQPGSPERPGELQADQASGPGTLGELAGNDLRQHHDEENVVSNSVPAHANGEQWPAWEVQMESTNAKSGQAAVAVETIETPRHDDVGPYQSESHRLSMGESNPPIDSGESVGWRDSRRDIAHGDLAEPKLAAGIDSKSEDATPDSKSSEGRAARERLGEGQTVPDPVGKANLVDLGIRADSEPASRGNPTSDTPPRNDSLKSVDDRLGANASAEAVFRKEIADLESTDQNTWGASKQNEAPRFDKVAEQRIAQDTVSSRTSRDSADKEWDFSLRATRTGGENSFPVFNLNKTHFEEKTGVKLEHDRLYHVVGSVDGAYDFDVYRRVTNYVRFMVPSEHRDSVEFGKVYNVRIKSIDEVQLTEAQREVLARSKDVQYRALMYRLRHAEVDSVEKQHPDSKEAEMAERNRVDTAAVAQRLDNLGASFTLRAYLQSPTDNRRFFRIPNSAFEEKTGVKLEEMRDYVINGRIDGVGDFHKNLHRCAARQDIPIHIPKKTSESVEVGKEYRVTIESIEKAPERHKPWEGIRIENGKPWTWQEVGAWIDTEGAFCSRTEKGGSYQVIISQKEKKVLGEISFFLEGEGLPSTIHLNKQTGVYNLSISGAERVARVIRQTEPFMRTENKLEEIAEFEKSISKPREHLWPSIRNARDILGLKESQS